VTRREWYWLCIGISIGIFLMAHDWIGLAAVVTFASAREEKRRAGYSGWYLFRTARRKVDQ
jgi:hypothetical protein